MQAHYKKIFLPQQAFPQPAGKFRYIILTLLYLKTIHSYSSSLVQVAYPSYTLCGHIVRYVLKDFAHWS